MKNDNRRVHERVLQRTPVRINTWRESDADSAFLNDLSYRGARLEVPVPLRTGEILTIELPKSRLGARRKVSARVVWVDKKTADGFFTVGCRFAT